MTKARQTGAAPQPTPGVPLSRFERQRERILDAATALLNQRGVAGMTLQDVAEQLGLKTTAVTYYFRYKEQLVTAVFADSLNRLEAMVSEAAKAPTPRERVDRYLQVHFDHYAASLRSEARPLAILSEIRGLESDARASLIGQYQTIFRGVRAFFGPTDTAEQKLKLTARAQMLNEAIFWSAIWLKQYEIADFDNVRRQFLDILDGGIAAETAEISPTPLSPKAPVEAGDSYSSFLKIATRSLNEVGYKGTSIDRIAAELNLTKGSFYHHLPTKDDLILQCFRNSYRRLWELYEQAAKARLNKWDTLISIIADAMKYQFEGEYPLLRTTALQALPDSVRHIPYEHSQSTTLFLTGLIVDSCGEARARNVNPLLASHIIMSTINSASDIRSWAAKQDLEQAVSNYLYVITRGIF